MRSASPRRMAMRPSRRRRNGRSPKRTASAVEPISAAASDRNVALSAYSNCTTCARITSALAATCNEIAPLLAGVDHALDHAQRLVAGSADIAAENIVGVGGRGGQTLELRAEQRFRGADFGRRLVEPGDLPIPAGEGEFELRRDNRRRRGVALFRGDRDIGDERLCVKLQRVVEIVFRRASVQRAEADAGEYEDRGAPERSRQEQSRRDRASLQKSVAYKRSTRGFAPARPPHRPQ